jgi:hypothetical protein
MAMYRLCLLGPALRIREVRRYWADTDKDALTIAKQIFEDDRWMGGFELLARTAAHRCGDESGQAE